MLGGSNIVLRGTIVVDLHGADGWLCEAMLHKNVVDKQKIVCATISHDEHCGKFMKHRLGDRVFSYCRDGNLKLTGFPDLKASFSVCGDHAFPRRALRLTFDNQLIAQELLTCFRLSLFVCELAHSSQAEKDNHAVMGMVEHLASTDCRAQRSG